MLGLGVGITKGVSLGVANANIQFDTDLNGTFAPSVVKSGAAATWIIDGVEYNTNTPSVALAGDTVSVELVVDDPTTVTRFVAINQGLLGLPTNLATLVNLDRLHLTGADISAPLSSLSWLWALTSLTQLWLDNTGLTGSLPAGVSALTSLQLLYLNTNSLSGNIPWSSLPTTLTQLYLNANQLTGAIEAECANLSSLQKLRLDSNDLTTYEDGALDISTLTEIRLQDNVRMAEVVVDGICNDFDGYASKAATGTLNLNNCAAPSSDSDTARTNLAADSWTVTVDATAGYQRLVTFEASPLGVVASDNGTEDAGYLLEARYRHGDTIFPSVTVDGTASAEIVASDSGVTPYQGSRMLKLAITGADADGQQGARYLQRWRHNEGSGSKLLDSYYYSCLIYLPAEVVLDGVTSDRFNNLCQAKYQSTANGSQAMFSLNSGHPSGSGDPDVYQFYLNHKRLGLSQIQHYQSSPVAIPVAQWFALEWKFTFSTTTGSDVNADGTLEMWQGVPGGTISKIFDLSSIRTIYDAEADGRLNWGPCAYGKGIVGGALTLYVDNIAISPTRLYT